MIITSILLKLNELEIEFCHKLQYALSSLHSTRCDGLRTDMPADCRGVLRQKLLVAESSREVPHYT